MDKLQKAFYINVCGPVGHDGCNDWSVCSTSTDNKNPNKLGSQSPKFVNSTGRTGFSMTYEGGKCDMGNGKTWETYIFMKCGKFLVSINPQGAHTSGVTVACLKYKEMFENIKKRVLLLLKQKVPRSKQCCLSNGEFQKISVHNDGRLPYFNPPLPQKFQNALPHPHAL